MFNNLDLNGRYLIACSGGPDSMALLDMAKNNIKYIEVAHVNYHKRTSAKNDENIVRRYCKKNNIKFHLANFNPAKVKGNFQASAREARYKFFNDVCKKNNLQAVLVAHHKDDLIETYLMQEQKHLNVTYYGLASSVYLYYVFVNRPLLEYTKKDLLDYCQKNNIQYGIDESNDCDIYTRNKIRHSIVDKMTLSQKNALVKKINKKNEVVLKHLIKASNYLAGKYDFSVKEFLKIPYLELGLRAYFGNKSDKFYKEMLRQIKESKTYVYKGEGYYITKEYDMVHIFEKPIEYSYKFKNIESLKGTYKYFKILKKGNSKQGVSLTKKDFPIVIRNCNNNDQIKMTYGTKKVNRFFIDNKIILKDRLTWPIVVNKNGIAILVPGLGCNIDHYSLKHDCFVIKL